MRFGFNFIPTNLVELNAQCGRIPHNQNAIIQFMYIAYIYILDATETYISTFFIHSPFNSIHVECNVYRVLFFLTPCTTDLSHHFSSFIDSACFLVCCGCCYFYSFCVWSPKSKYLFTKIYYHLHEPNGKYDVHVHVQIGVNECVRWAHSQWIKCHSHVIFYGHRMPFPMFNSR